jgi:hypothetical protein
MLLTGVNTGTKKRQNDSSVPSKVQWSTFARTAEAKIEPAVFLTETETEADTHSESDLSYDLSVSSAGESSKAHDAGIQFMPQPPPTSPSPETRGQLHLTLGMHTKGMAAGTGGWDPSASLTQHMKKSMKYEEIYTLR